MTGLAVDADVRMSGPALECSGSGSHARHRLARAPRIAAVCAIFVLCDGELVEMVEQPYVAEADLQGHLAAHPELLSAEAAEDERRRWLLVRREMGVADREGGTDRWSLDHLFVDQDGIPTFVEV